jgi:2-octaprenyl-3-methyl-6-methoxy-1,4-benzoquinol hydroxylase
VWSLPEDEAARLLALDDASFLEALTRAFDARLGAVVETSTRRAFPLERKLAGHMLSGRVALLGDAAHVVHPLAGQGVNLGLRDASALAPVLGAAKQAGRDLAGTALQRWARTRESDNAVSSQAFDAINRVFSNDAMLPTLLRSHLLGIANVPPLTRLLWRRAAGL